MEFLTQIQNHFEHYMPHLHQMVRVAPFRTSSPETNSRSTFLVCCLSQTGELLVHKLDLVNRVQQLITKIYLTHRTNSSLIETVLDF